MAPREFETETIMKGNTSPMARLRRSASAPSSSTKLVEEHYRVEGDTTASRVVLPGVPKHEADWARDAHDFFNLVVLVRVSLRVNCCRRVYSCCCCCCCMLYNTEERVQSMRVIFETGFYRYVSNTMLFHVWK